jgi:sarcosine oxidase
MANRRHDVLVLGVGGMGAAALARLALRGVSVIGVEQDGVPSERGSSAGETRVIRKAYFEDPRYVPLIERAYVLWRELEAFAGEPLLVRTGCLNVGPPDHPDMLGVRESVAIHSLRHELLDEKEMRARFPALVPSAGDIGVFEDDGGYLRVEACTRAHARLARENGATLLVGRRVTELAIEDSGVRATLDDGTTIDADRVVVSAGAWLASHPALARVAEGMRLSVERQVQLYFQPEPPEVVRAPKLPVFIHFAGDRAFYGLPLHGEGALEPALKVCRHHGGHAASAETLDRVVHDSDVEPVREWMRAHLPAGDGPLLRARVCMYTNTPDRHFMIGAPRAVPRAIVLGGFSGHGFKMASVMGEIAADLATGASSAFDLALFDPDRFAG